jgi:hypothetical protein
MSIIQIHLRITPTRNTVRFKFDVIFSTNFVKLYQMSEVCDLLPVVALESGDNFC